MRNEAKYTSGGLKEMLVIALPIVVSQSCDTLMVFTDRFFMSKLGTVQMNAVMSGGLSSYLMICFFTGIIGFSTALVGQYLGANRKAMCSVATSQSLLLALLAYPVVLLMKPLVYQLFGFMELSDEQMVFQRIYFDILVYGTIIGLLRSALTSYFSGIGRTRIIMISMLVTMLVNISVNYVIIFGRFGCPALGIKGAAYGTLIGGVSGLLILFAAYLKKHNVEEFEVFSSFRLDLNVTKKLLWFGTPPGIEMMLTMLAFNTIVLVFQAHNAVSAAAASIMFSWDMVSYVPLIGVEIAITSLVGRYMGARRVDLAEKSALSGIKIGLIFSAVILVLFLGFPGLLADVFRPRVFDPVFEEARPLAIFMLRLAVVYVAIEASIVVFIGVLRGAGDTFFAMVLSTLMHWMMAIGIYLALNRFNASAQTAWGIAVASFFVMGIAFYLRYRGGKWKEIRMVEE